MVRSPYAQRAAGRARFDGEPHEELVDGEAVRERRGAGDLERVAAAPVELVAVAAQLGGDDAGADLVEHPGVESDRRDRRRPGDQSGFGVFRS